MTLLRTFDESDELVLHQLFFALLPDADAIVEIARVRASLGAAESHELDRRLHMPLFALDLPITPPSGLIEDMGRAATRLVAPAMRICLQEVASDGKLTRLTPGQPMPVLRGFQQRLALALADIGIWPNRGFRFDPHVILAQGQAESFRRPVWPVSWRAREFVLVHSLVGLTEHVELGRWSLAG